MEDADCDVVVLRAPSSISPTALEAAKGTNIGIGAQNCHWAKSPAPSPAKSPPTCSRSMGVQYVIIGHSERRTVFRRDRRDRQRRVYAPPWTQG